MQIFIAHKDSDTERCKFIADFLGRAGFGVYLDAFDESRNIDDLTDHLRYQLSRSSALLAVVSDATRYSWWVPWEIGIATEKGHAISTFALDNVSLPQYLTKWPYLTSAYDLAKYVNELSSHIQQINEDLIKSASATKSAAKSFHRSLKRTLGQ